MKKNIINAPDLNKTRKRNLAQEVRIIYDELVVPDIVQKKAPGLKFLILTYGCQANVRDQEVMEGMLLQAGYTKTNNIKNAALIILNTCAVRENAEQKVLGKLGSLKSLKENNKDLIIAVSGCMIGEPVIVDTLLNKYHQVDLMFGTNEIKNLLNYLAKVYQNKEVVVAANDDNNDIVELLPSTRLSSFKAYVNIMYGCDKFCTYCIVPYTRGQQRSRSSVDILKECQDLKARGYQEITLLGQNVNAYGKDLKQDISFGALLKSVAATSIPRVRFLTSHPWDFSDEILEAFLEYPNLMPYLHLPIQAGSDRILTLMGRRYHKNDYLNLITKIRLKLPHIAISTDIIVGFPNETDQDFMETIDVVKKVRFDSAFTFIYSPRDGTPAARMPDDVPYKTKSQRFISLVNELEQIIEVKSQQYLGKTVKVLVDGVSKNDPEMLNGYTEDNKLTHFKGPKTLIGSIAKVRINSAHIHYLLGELDAA
ncbi:MAG: tRNA (N6-isopentenyl adenosine(37)-C2)-methylthiotransferase MiaB [Erysipelotrichaceae bacterium]|nr:tRNA (N6-isopentenyl adenosine(37)-C2)-methylthiotransferase MiaB [Erysipelotrichaceae bacterium]